MTDAEPTTTAANTMLASGHWYSKLRSFPSLTSRVAHAEPTTTANAAATAATTTTATPGH